MRRPGGDCLSSRLKPSRVNYGLSSSPPASFLPRLISSRLILAGRTSPHLLPMLISLSHPSLPAAHCEIHQFVPKYHLSPPCISPVSPSNVESNAHIHQTFCPHFGWALCMLSGDCWFLVCFCWFLEVFSVLPGSLCCFANLVPEAFL